MPFTPEILNDVYDSTAHGLRTTSAPATSSSRDLLDDQKTTITSSTAETTIVTAEAGKFLDIYALILTNTSATATTLTIKDDTAGTTRFVFELPARETRGFTLPKESAHKQAVANKPWTATCGTSVASVEITAMFVRNS